MKETYTFKALLLWVDNYFDSNWYKMKYQENKVTTIIGCKENLKFYLFDENGMQYSML